MYETINGYPIIGTYLTPGRGWQQPGRIILVDRGDGHEERYVVAWQAYHDSHGPQWESGWMASSYCRSLKSARKVFIRRINKEPV